MLFPAQRPISNFLLFAVHGFRFTAFAVFSLPFIPKPLPLAAHDDMESSVNSRKSGSSRFTVSGISKVIEHDTQPDYQADRFGIVREGL
jgi:hypothetical protein